MTAYSAQEITAPWGRANCELRSVNHRRLEISLHLPKALLALEPAVRDQISTCLQRGRIECAIRYAPSHENNAAFTVNEPLLQQILAACEQIGQRSPLRIALNPIDALRWPGVLEKSSNMEKSSNIDHLKPDINQLVDNALQGMQAAREREGQEIHARLAEGCGASRSILGALRGKLPKLMEEHRRQLLERAQDLSIDLDPARLAQEALFLAQKHDIKEEVDRLDMHLNEVEEVMSRPEPAGRRLDFMMQEMHREANTLGAKSSNVDTTRASVELRLLIDQMREQVQNVE